MLGRLGEGGLGGGEGNGSWDCVCLCGTARLSDEAACLMTYAYRGNSEGHMEGHRPRLQGATIVDPRGGGDCVASEVHQPKSHKLLTARRAGDAYIEGKGGSPPTPAGHGHPRGPQLA